MINQNAGGYYPQQDYVQQPNRQVTFYWVTNINEAYNWGIAPGSSLIFRDQDNKHVYIKSLNTPYEKPVFEVFTKEQQQVEDPQTNDDSLNVLKDEISKIKEALKKLNNKISDRKVGD